MSATKDRVDHWAAATGLHRAVAGAPARECLFVVNYRRIGDPDATAFDPDMFSATAEEFEEQVQYLRSHLHVAGLDEAVAFALGGSPWKGAAALITFDYGYLDDYRIAFPILASAGTQGVFFLPAAYIGTGRTAWWDRIAYMVRHSSRAVLELDYPTPARFPLENTDRLTVVRAMLRLYESGDTGGERFLHALEEATGVALPAAERLFLNWDEVREMARDGMAVGCGTHGFEALGKLPAQQQYDELSRSRRVLEEQLKMPVNTLAYPVGSRHSFSDTTYAALARAGYRAAFSCYGGVYQLGRTDPYDIRRIAAAGERKHASPIRTARISSARKDAIR
ncbi:MAG TPA: polysaccharide deacetylase family protein [Bryobacteraceae bacterium]|nr:polysaccharide deacetylase family protein [Bryobacteraceae bacterium]